MEPAVSSPVEQPMNMPANSHAKVTMTNNALSALMRIPKKERKGVMRQLRQHSVALAKSIAHIACQYGTGLNVRDELAEVQVFSGASATSETRKMGSAMRREESEVALRAPETLPDSGVSRAQRREVESGEVPLSAQRDWRELRGAQRAAAWRAKRSPRLGPPAPSRSAQEGHGESSRDGSLLCTPQRVAAVKLVTNADTPVIQRALRTAAGVADTAAAIILQAADARANIDQPARDGANGDDARNAQASNSTPAVSTTVAGNCDQAGKEQPPDSPALAQEQSSDPPALAQEQSTGQDDGHPESHHGAEAPQKGNKKYLVRRRGGARARREESREADTPSCT